MKRCLECSISIVSGSHCSLCAKAMISNNNSMEASMKSSTYSFATTVLSLVISDFQAISNNKKAYAKALKGVSMKPKLIINDLELESSNLFYGQSFNLSNDNGEEAEVENNEVSQHDGDYLQYMENATMNLKTAKALLKYYKTDFTDLSDEVIILLAEQKKDRSENGSAFTYNTEDRVEVIVQRKSTEGRWYNAKKKDIVFGKTRLSFFFEKETVFDLDDNGTVINLKMDQESGEPALIEMMYRMGYSNLHNQYLGNGESVILEQRFMIASSALRSVTALCSTDIAHVPASFKNRYDAETKSIVKEYTFFTYDNITDLGNGIAVLPCDNAESIEETLNRLHSNGILIGKAEADSYMASADIQEDEVDTAEAQYSQVKKDGRKESIIAAKKNEAIEERLASSSYAHTLALIQKSHKGEAVDFEPVVSMSGMSRSEQNKVRLAHYKEQLKNARTYEAQAKKNARLDVHTKATDVNTRAFMPEDFTTLTQLIEACTRNALIDIVGSCPANVLTHIAQLNNKKKTPKDFTREELKSIYEAAKAHRDDHKEFNIKIDIAREIARLVA